LKRRADLAFLPGEGRRIHDHQVEATALLLQLG
jgi:hypothetical protein